MGTGEAELLQAARQGDHEAFARLVRPSLDTAYRLALRVLGDAAEAEDAVQDALYSAWRGLARFRGGAKFSTWLYRIVWRQCVDRLRRPQPAALTEQAADVSFDNDPATRVETLEAESRVERALRQLPAAYRTVLTLFYIEDLPIKDVARITGLSLGTVKTHLHRARKELRKLLEESEVMQP